MTKIGKSLKNINWKLFISLMVMGLCPTIYTTLRGFFLGQLPGDWSFSIAGQLSWVNLLYEILNEGIILPLYFFMGKVVENKSEYTNRIKTGLIVSFCIYTVCSIIIICFANPLLAVMATSKEIINQSAIYIRIESVANKKKLDKYINDTTVESFASEDKNRGYGMTGVYNDPEGYKVATDGHMIFAEKADISEENAGKVTYSNGVTQEENYPKWRKVIPENAEKEGDYIYGKKNNRFVCLHIIVPCDIDIRLPEI